MNVHQCPRCELRFRNETELRYHLTVDHAVDPQAVEQISYGAARQQRPLYPDFVERDRGRKRRVLVVSNATLRAQRLEDTLNQLAAEGDVRFHLVVPAAEATPVTGEHSWFETTGEVAHPREADLSGRSLAKHRLREALTRLRAAGLHVDGSVGDPDPLQATADALEDFPADAIVLSTLPRAQSDWLDADLHIRMERQFTVPITLVAAA